MRIAVSLSGQPRFFKACYPLLKKNLLDHYDCDIFFHTWTRSDDKKGIPWPSASWNKGRSDIYPGTQVLMTQLKSLYEPNGCIFEDQDIVLQGKDWSRYPKTNGENLAEITHFMFYSMRESMNLVRDYQKDIGVKYDAVIRTRFDAALLSKPDIYPVRDSEIYYLDVCRNPSVMSDWFFWGTPDNAFSLCSVFDRLDDYCFGKNVLLCGEEMLTHDLDQKGLIRVPKKTSMFLVRDDEFINKDFGKTW